MMNPHDSPKKKQRKKGLANETLEPCLLCLPEEIICYIISYLDMRSKVQVWKTCTQLRRILSGRGRIPRATYDLLNNYNLHLEELNISGVKGCSEAEAVSALIRLRNLQSLDVTYTPVTLLGANKICAACPQLARLSCGVSKKDVIPLTSTNLDYVHLVCNEPISWKDLEDLVQAPNLKEYKFTDCEPVYKFDSGTLRWRRDRFPKLQSSSYHFKDEKNSVHSFNKGNDDIVPGEWDFVLILDSVLNFRFDTDFFGYIYDAKIILSERLQQAASSVHSELSDIFQKVTSHDKQLNSDFTAHLYLWHPCITELNPNLYTDVIRDIDSKFLQVVCNSLHSGPPPVTASTRRQHQVDTENQLYYVCPCTFKLDGEEKVLLSLIKKRYDLNLYASVPSDRNIKLILQNLCNNPSSICCNMIKSDNFPVLSNIVHLSLLFDADSSPIYSCEDLFTHCVNLHTLEIRIVYRLSEIVKNLQCCKSIRNLLLEVNDELYNDDKMCLKHVCNSLMKCPSLENLVLLTINVPIDVYWEDCFSNVGEFKLVLENFFVNCSHLCSLYFDSRNKELHDEVTGILRRLGITDLNVNFGDLGGGDYTAYPHYYKIFVKDTKFASLQMNKKLILSQKKDRM